VETYPNARRPEWPAADFIAGNPPFVAGQNFREEYGNAYAEALWEVHPHISGGADLVMYWWDRAAELLTRRGTRLRRFGFITTNSITQEFSCRVLMRHMEARTPISLLLAIPDHPWTEATKDSADVRIAMTVAAKGKFEGVLRKVVREKALDTDDPQLEFTERSGEINPDLSIGANITKTQKLNANFGICHDGVKLHGRGFVITPQQAEFLGLGRRQGLEKFVRPYRNGRDLAATPRDLRVIDLFGLEADEVRTRFPEIYQHLLVAVKPERDKNNREVYRTNWWIFGEPRRELRPAVADFTRYIATVDTAKHRVFQFLDNHVICDDKVIIVASEDAFLLGILSSAIHKAWADHVGGLLGPTPVYVKSKVFDPFPFPLCDNALKCAFAQSLKSWTHSAKPARKSIPGSR
jgi:hypothetical protein